MATEPTKPNYLILLAIVVAGVLFFRSMGSGDPKPTPGPTPVPVVASEHLNATLEYGAALQQHIKATITKLQAGELTDETATRDWIKLGREAALKAAWTPVAERDVTAFADGWTVEKQIARLQQLIK